MERQIYFENYPKPMDWGDKKIVPLNINQETNIEDGQTKTSFRADLVPKVEQPVTVNSIVDAAIQSEFDEKSLKRIMRNFGHSDDEEVSRYKNFVQEITEAAKEAGYE